MSMVRKLQIWYFRKQAAKAYLRWKRIRGYYDCGNVLANVFSNSLREARDDVNDLFSKLKALKAPGSEKLPILR
jgi:hypothetical protein